MPVCTTMTTTTTTHRGLGRGRAAPRVAAAAQVSGARLWWRALLVLASAAVLTGGAATVASAHDALVGTSPADGSTVGAVPGRVTLTFDEPALALGSTVVVAGPDGRVMSGRTRVTDNRVTQAVQPGAPAGRYTVTWRVTSVDGHPVSGKFSGFTATAAAPGARAQSTARPQARTVDRLGPRGGSVRRCWFAWWIYGAGAAVVAAVAAQQHHPTQAPRVTGASRETSGTSARRRGHA